MPLLSPARANLHVVLGYRGLVPRGRGREVQCSNVIWGLHEGPALPTSRRFRLKSLFTSPASPIDPEQRREAGKG